MTATDRETLREREENHCGTFDLWAASHNNDLFGPAWLWSPKTKAPASVSFFFFYSMPVVPKKYPTNSRLWSLYVRTYGSTFIHAESQGYALQGLSNKHTHAHTRACTHWSTSMLKWPGKRPSSLDLPRTLTLAQAGANHGPEAIGGLINFLNQRCWTWWK